MLSPFPQTFSIRIDGNSQRKTCHQVVQKLSPIEKKPYWGNHFWPRGYFVNTIGLDEDIIRRYVRYQEEQDKKEENPRTFRNLRIKVPLKL